MAEAVVVVEELAANGMPMLIWVISPAICGSILAHHGSEAMKREWLPDLADGSRKMAFGLTEPDAGSNSHKVATTARRTATGWTPVRVEVLHLCGRPGRGVLVVAKDAEQSTPEKSALSLFVVPTNSPGLQMQEIPDLHRLAGQAVHACSSTTSRSARTRSSVKPARDCVRCSPA